MSSNLTHFSRQFQLLAAWSRSHQNIDGKYPEASTGLPDTGDSVDGKTLESIVNQGRFNQGFHKMAVAGLHGNWRY